jgi:hypothetical protein
MKYYKYFFFFVIFSFFCLQLSQISFAQTSPACSYVKKENKVFYCDLEITTADYSTFSVENINPNWAKDKNYVYFREKALENSQVDTFQFLALPGQPFFGYAKDSNQVYYNGIILEADPATFSLVSSETWNPYGRDKNAVYYRSDKLENSDPATFFVIGTYYAKDKGAVYYISSRLENSDPVTFETLRGSFGYQAKDKNNIYYRDIIVKNADPDTYQILGDYYTKDKNAVYFEGEKIVADSATFKIEMNDDPRSYCGSGPVKVMDEKYFYYKGFIVCDIADADQESIPYYYENNIKYSKSRFSDVGTYKYQTAIDELAKLNIVQGYSDGTFKPNQLINRAEFLKIILEAKPLVSFDTTYNNCFLDVKNDQWFAKYVCYDFKQGYISGYPDGFFRPEKSINYVEALKILYKSYGEQGNPNFTSFWFSPYFEDAKENAIALKDLGNKYDHLLTRGEVAELIIRFLSVYAPYALG